jgi:cell division septation protein DedD
MRCKGNVLKFVIGICALAVAAGFGLSSANAQDEGRVSGTAETQALAAVHVGPDKSAETARPYFVEFRARSAYSYGHTFLVHGRSGQKITAKDVIGLHPAGESSTPWMLGHLVPVVSETGASDGDFEEAYIIARYRVGLTEAEYKKALGMMRDMQKNHPVWHAVLYNCNRFVGDIAQNIGLQAPSNALLMPKEFITELKNLNGGRPELSGPAATQVAQKPAASQTAEAPAAERAEAAPAPKRQEAAAATKRKPAPAAQPARQEASVSVQSNQYSRPEW